MKAPALHVSGTARMADTTVFGPVDLTAPAGEWTCLLGPSGIGKTTLLRLIAGVDSVTRFDGEISASDGHPLPGRLALMAQDDLLMPWLDVTENVMLGARLRGEQPDRARAADVLGRVGLSAHSGKRPAALSGGERQRVALARTLMEDRAIVLLDEPFSALDARTRARMQELSAEHLAGRTVLMVTHDPAEAARLGQSILLLTEVGLDHVAVPGAPPPRAVDDDDTLRAQGVLFNKLRGAA